MRFRRAPSTEAAFALGGAWYSARLFGTTWLEEVGLTEEAVQSATMPRTFGSTFVLQFLAITALAGLIGADGSWLGGLQTGAVVSVFRVSTACGITHLFEQRSLRLWLINAGYNVVLFSVAGAILGAWR